MVAIDLDIDLSRHDSFVRNLGAAMGLAVAGTIS